MTKFKILNFHNLSLNGENISILSPQLRTFKREQGVTYIASIRQPMEYLNYFLGFLIKQYPMFSISKNIEILNDEKALIHYLRNNNFIPMYNPQTFHIDKRKQVLNAKKNLEKFDYVVPYEQLEVFAERFDLPIVLPQEEKKTFFSTQSELRALIDKDIQLYQYAQELYDKIQSNAGDSLQNILPKFKSYVDKVSPTEIIGWVYVTQKKAEPVDVELYVDDKKVKTVKANLFKPKIKEKKWHPTGKCGFIFKLDNMRLTANNKIKLKVKKYGFIIPFGKNIVQFK